ncbi:XRE family transcriptional regulator [Actinoallomurus acanthiterrae]
MTDAETLVCERLRAARQAAGVTQQDAANALGVSRPLLVAMEKGTRKVRPAELVTLARLYGRQVSELVRPQPPVEALGAQFRLALTRRSDTPDLESLVGELERLGDDFLDLARRSGAELPRRYPATVEPPSRDLEDAAEDLAVEERRRLGLGDGPIWQLREILEDEVGIRIFMPEMPSRVAGVIVFAEPLGACVAVNRNHPVQRRRWTLSHEYAHFLTRRERSEVTLMGERRPAEERFADFFAANFLMPRSGLRRRFLELHRLRPKGPTLADLFQLARVFRVSLQALMLRLEDLKLVPSGAYDRLQPNLRPAEAERLLGMAPDVEPAELLPLRYRYLAAELFAEGEITEGQLAGYLREDRVRARQIVQSLTTSRDITQGGVTQSVRMDEAVC